MGSQRLLDNTMCLCAQASKREYCLSSQYVLMSALLTSEHNNYATLKLAIQQVDFLVHNVDVWEHNRVSVNVFQEQRMSFVSRPRHVHLLWLYIYNTLFLLAKLPYIAIVWFHLIYPTFVIWLHGK